MSKGAYRVGLSFNPSSNSVVDQVKKLAAELIDLIDTIEPPAIENGPVALLDGEVARLKALAMTNVEDAAMWAVKAATKRPPEGK